MRGRRVEGWSGRPRALAIAVGTCALALAPVVGAQEPDSVEARSDSVRFELEALRVEATRPTLVGGGAAAVDVRLDSLRLRPSPTLEEALRRLPLIRMRRNSRGEVQPSLRGMEEREIAVLVDGVPITLGWDNRADLSVIPLTAAREIRVVRGLSSVLSGPNVLGGVVEVGISSGPFPPVPQDPPFALRAGVDQTGAAQASAQAGHLWERGAGGLWLRYGGGWRERDGSAVPSGLAPEARDADGHLLNSDLRHLNGFLALRWQQPDGGPWLALSSSAFHAERGVTPELHLLGGVDPEPRLWRIPDHWRSLTALSGGTGWRSTPWGRGDLEASVGLDVQHLEIDAFDSVAFRDSVAGETGNDRTLTLRLLGDHTLGPGIVRTAITLAETWHEEILSGREPAEFRQRWWSVGLETDQPLAPQATGTWTNPRLTVGASLDGASTPETGGRPAQPGITGWGGRVAGQVTVGGRTTLHGGASRKVRFPALRELFSGALGRFVPNPELEPLTLKVLEAGATFRVGRSAKVQATLFDQRLEGAIVRAALPDGRFQRQNRGSTRATGLELLANAGVGPVDLRWDLNLQDVRLRDAEAEAAGERPEYQPAIASGLHAGVGAWGALQLEGALELLGRQFGADARTGTFERLGSILHLELGASRRFGASPGGLPPSTISVGVENVTDRAIFDQLGLPRPGRTLHVQASIF